MTRAVLAAAGLLLALPAGAGVRPRPGGTLRVLLGAEPRELDPARAASPAALLLARALHATLYELDGEGVRPGLAEEPPEVAQGGREVRIRLRAGLRFHDGSPVTAADAVESLARLLRPETASPHAGIVAALEGAEAVLMGRERTPSGLQVVSDRELRLLLSRPRAELARALAAAPAAVVRAVPDGLLGAGPFRLASRAADGLRLVPFEGHHRGRPWADAVALSWPDPVAAARRLARGEADLALRPEGTPGLAARAIAPLGLVIAQVSGRLGPGAEPVRAALASLDRAELARLLRGPNLALRSLLPASSWGSLGLPSSSATPGSPSPGLPLAPAQAGPPAAALAASPTPTSRLVLLAPTSLKALADRIQVKLFDRGMRAAVELVPDADFAQRLASGAHDVALVPVALASEEPGAALLQVAAALAGAGGVLAAERALAAGPATAAAELEVWLRAVPLAAAGLRLSAAPAVQGLAVAGDGTVDLAEAWLLPGRRSTP